MLKRMIPNLLTMGNLFCGLIAILLIFRNEFTFAAIAVITGIAFDFLDGFVARLLKVTGELGKQLDSLADMVTSGVVPGLVMYKLLRFSLNYEVLESPTVKATTMNSWVMNDDWQYYIPYLGFLITLGSAYRLAKFNIDTRQTSSFIGLPTPANTLLIFSLVMIFLYQPSDWSHMLLTNHWFLILVTILSTYLLNAELPLFALKFKNYGWRGNEIRYVFLLLSILFLVFFQFVGIPLTILLYIILSVISNKK